MQVIIDDNPYIGDNIVALIAAIAWHWEKIKQAIPDRHVAKMMTDEWIQVGNVDLNVDYGEVTAYLIVVDEDNARRSYTDPETSVTIDVTEEDTRSAVCGACGEINEIVPPTYCCSKCGEWRLACDLCVRSKDDTYPAQQCFGCDEGSNFSIKQED